MSHLTTRSDNMNVPTPHFDAKALDMYAIFGRVKPVLDALHEVIASKPDGIPSGHLYAMLMGRVDLEDYNWMISIMVKAGGITNTNHLLKVVK